MGLTNAKIHLRNPRLPEGFSCAAIGYTGETRQPEIGVNLDTVFQLRGDWLYW